MPDDQAVAAPDAQEQYIQQMLRQLQTQPQAATGARAQVAQPSSFTGLLGSTLGGGPSGSVPLSADEADASGNRALLNFGLNLLANSGYSTDRKTIGQLIGGGIGAAQQSLGQSEYMKAARGQAQQDYAAQQQEMQIARIKEAVPLLTLQQQIAQRKALQNMPSPFGNTNIGAAGGSAANTYEGAIGGIEGTGKNPASTAFGTGQFLESTWNDFAAANPDLFKGMTPAQVLAARANPELGNKAITWLAQQNATTLASNGVAPSGASLGIAHWVGAGPAVQIMKAPDNAPVAPFLSAEAIKANPQLANMTAGQMRARYGNVPAPSFLAAKPSAPGAPGAPASTATPAPDVAPTGQQFAGPGAPPNAVATPPSPAATSNANAIMAGMVGAGAEPTTLAPGGAAPPAPNTQIAGLVAPPGVTPPPGATAAPVAPPPVTPGDVAPTFEQHLQQHPIVAPPDMQALFNAKPDPDQLALFQSQKAKAASAYNHAKAMNDGPGMQKAIEAGITADAGEATVRENAAKLGRDAQTNWTKDRLTQAHDEWVKMREVAETRETERLKAIRDQTNAQADAAQKQRDALALEAARGDEQRRTASAATENSYVLKQREQFAADHDATRGALGDYQTLRMFSDAAGKSTPIDNLQFGDKSGRDILAQWGFGTQAQREQWGAQQAFNAVINKSILAARQGVSMGQLSDRDMNFLQHMTVSQMQDPQTRSDIISYLEQTAYKKKAYMDRVEQLWDGGKGLTWGNARSAAEKEFEAPERDVVPRVPPDWKTLPPQLQQQFLEQNRINHGSLVRQPNGKLGRYEVPQQ